MMQQQEEVSDCEKSGGRKFSEFYEKWMVQLEDILRQLLKAINSNKHHQNGIRSSEASTSSSAAAAAACDGDHDGGLESLVSKVTTHQKQYYAAKWAAAHEDVLAFYAPSWLSPLEIAYSWVTGWKPSMAFRVLDSLRKRAGTEWQEGADDDNEKVRKIGELRVRIGLEEDKVDSQMERQRIALKGLKGGSGVVALKGLKIGLEKVMKAADCVRLKTMKGVLDILTLLTPNSKQCVEFLADAFLLQIQLSKLGGLWWQGSGSDQQWCKCVNVATFQLFRSFQF